MSRHYSGICKVQYILFRSSSENIIYRTSDSPIHEEPHAKIVNVRLSRERSISTCPHMFPQHLALVTRAREVVELQMMPRSDTFEITSMHICSVGPRIDMNTSHG